jgi:hypothetical protein
MPWPLASSLSHAEALPALGTPGGGPQLRATVTTNKMTVAALVDSRLAVQSLKTHRALRT